MQIGDQVACEHCAPEAIVTTTENGSPIVRQSLVCHPIESFDGARPVLECPSLYTDQIHESARMRLVGTAARP